MDGADQLQPRSDQKFQENNGAFDLEFQALKATKISAIMVLKELRLGIDCRFDPDGNIRHRTGLRIWVKVTEA